MDFTARQLSAIDIGKRHQDMCVVAGPGSGKTTVLVERFRRLVRDAGLAPSRILAITFTEKAAAHMKAKLAEALRDRPQDRSELERAWVSTVHGFCMRLLRENAIFAGIDPEFRVLDERQATTLEIQAAGDALDQVFRERPEESRRLMRALAGNDLGRAMRDVYEAMRASGAALHIAAPPECRPAFADLAGAIRALEYPRGWKVAQLEEFDRLREWGERYRDLAGASMAHFEALETFVCNLNRFPRSSPLYERLREIKDLQPQVYRGLLTQYYAPQRETLGEVLCRFDRVYRERKQQLGVLDYSDLEDIAVRLLEENADVRRRMRAQFDQVLMDEFQDTNGLQAKLVGLVRPADRFYAVGDINQAIYGFRHADPEVFRRYRDAVASSGQPVAELVENWRSRADILRAVSTIMRGAEGIEERALVPGREFPEKAGPSVEVIAAETPELEAQWVARRILELAGGMFGRVAVLVRNSEVLGVFAKAFDEFGIPYLVSRGKGFYETPEIRDLTHMLRVLVNPRDEISMAAVLRSPLVEISDEALMRWKASVGEFAEDDARKLARFHARLEEWRGRRDCVGIDRLLVRALDETGYPYEPGSRAAANIDKFLAIAREASARLTLAGFVEELEIVRAADPREADAPPEDSANAVRVMTVHAAKGLEFPIVFLAALNKGVDSGLGVLSFSPRIGLGVRWRNPVTGEEKDDALQHAIREERKRREAEEANRLFYVAMTRAEEHLVLSFSAIKEWAGTLQAALGLRLDTGEHVARIQAPDGGEFPVLVRPVSAPPEKPPRPESAHAHEAPLRLPPPAVSGQHDSNATVTDITLFVNCPRRYYLERYLGWQGRARGGSGGDAREFGTEVHALLAGQQVNASEEARRLAAAFAASPLGKRVARATRVEREYDFLLAVEDVVLRGQIDLWFEESGELVVVDYKTDDATPEHAQAYGPQLRLYGSALRRITGRQPGKAYVYMLRANAAVEIDLPPPLFDDLDEIVRGFREAQSTLRFPLKEGEQCLRCPYYRGLCPSGVREIIHPPAVDG